MMPVPRRHEETVMGAPRQIFTGAFGFSDRSDALALHDVINAAARVTVRRGCFSRRNHLHPAAIVGMVAPPVSGWEYSNNTPSWGSSLPAAAVSLSAFTVSRHLYVYGKAALSKLVVRGRIAP